MTSSESDTNKAHKGIYLLPNLFTTAALFSGFYAIIHGMREQFISASVAIFIAMIMDFLDGRVARLTHTQTAFGAQYDSLSDLVAFGLAPALVMYTWMLHDLGRWGWLAAFLYAATTALRLARFNSRMENTQKCFFYGLPSPSGAGVLAGFVWIANDFGWSGHFIAILAAILTVCTGLLMVSNVKYRSAKDLDFKGRIPFFVLLLVVCVFVLVAIAPPQVVFTCFFLYWLSGPVLWLFRYKRKK